MYIMCVLFVQRFDPRGRRFTNFHFYYYYYKEAEDGQFEKTNDNNNDDVMLHQSVLQDTVLFKQNASESLLGWGLFRQSDFPIKPR